MHIFTRIKVLFVILGLSMSSVVFYGFADDYFGVSKNLEIFIDVYENLNKYYVDETNPGELMKTGIDAMLLSLDPYTNFYPESDIEDFRFLTTGQYGGIGALIRTRGETVLIAEPYEGFPAHKEGLKAGDIILEVNGKTATGKTTEELSKVLKGQPGSPITLKIRRDSENKTFESLIMREEIKVNDVPYSGIVGEDVGYIKLNSFTETASSELKAAFKDLKENKGAKAMIVDLRGNGGGLLREAVSIVNVFIERGQKVVETKGRVKNWESVHTTLNAPLDTEMPLVVLIDPGSASASEIVSGAIQDLDRGVVIGQKSFGKGLVQQNHNLGYNAKMKITVAKYYIPSGRCIQRLDYSHRTEDGIVEEVPDSLITEFKTSNGRKVYDGGGIDPDIKVKEREASNILAGVVTGNHIFDFATEYASKKADLAAAGDFRLSDEEFDQFKAFLKEREFTYSTRSEKALEKFKKIAESEKYYDGLQDQYTALLNQIEVSKENDIDTFKDEIVETLENEIVSRYHYQSGRIEASLSRDPELAKALEVLKDKALYDSILDGTYDAGEDN